MSKYVNLKNTLILFLILYYIAAVVGVQSYYRLDLYENLGKDSKRVFNFLRYSLEPLALHSAWTYFPEPPKKEMRFLIQGHAEVFSAYYIPPGFRYSAFQINDKRGRRFHQHITRDAYKDIRTAYLKSFCGKFQQEHGIKFDKVTFHKYKKQIPGPTSAGPTKLREVNNWTVKC